MCVCVTDFYVLYTINYNNEDKELEERKALAAMLKMRDSLTCYVNMILYVIIPSQKSL